MLSSLADPRGIHYTPHPRGLAAAREAVAAELCDVSGVDVGSGQVVLTASTSEAYTLLFKLLVRSRRRVLVPQPSYPLFELLTGSKPSPPRRIGSSITGAGRSIASSLERALTPRTRAVLVVSPNNPTGSMLRAADRDWLVALCAARDIALISDEVFADYPLARARRCARPGRRAAAR